MPQKLKCIVCGYTEIADCPPKRCPVCQAESDRFNTIPFTPEWLDVGPMINTINVIDSTKISYSQNPPSSSKLAAENLILQPGETVDDFSLEDDSILVVLEGEASISSDNPIKYLTVSESSQLEDSSEMNEDKKVDINAEGKGVEPGLFAEDASDDEVKAEFQPEACNTYDSKLKDSVIKRHHAIFLPGSTELMIRNNGENQLLLLIVY
jgi:hypothetical protein